MGVFDDLLGGRAGWTNLKPVEVVAQIERVMSASQALTKELDFEIIKKIIESGLADQ